MSNKTNSEIHPEEQAIIDETNRLYRAAREAFEEYVRYNLRWIDPLENPIDFYKRHADYFIKSNVQLFAAEVNKVVQEHLAK